MTEYAQERDELWSIITASTFRAVVLCRYIYDIQHTSMILNGPAKFYTGFFVWKDVKLCRVLYNISCNAMLKFKWLFFPYENNKKMLYQFWSAITILALALNPVVYHNTLNLFLAIHSHEHVPHEPLHIALRGGVSLTSDPTSSGYCFRQE